MRILNNLRASAPERERAGFTLAELLIVVAIIAILIAIMVPVFGSSRADAIQAKDAANVRSAYAEAVTTAMTEQSYVETGTYAGKLEVTLDITTLDIDDTTKVTAKPTSKPTSIKIETKNAKAEPEEIKVDDNVKLTLKTE